jgi:uncharacterized protein (DUF58 family)
MQRLAPVAVDYRVRWRPSGVLPGSHRGAQAGSGQDLRAVVPFEHRPDPRRMDLRASLRDPFDRLWVRDFKQNAALKVYVLADVSASMAYQGRYDKWVELRKAVMALAYSAWRSGDRFGLLAADTRLRSELSLPARSNKGAADWLDRRLQDFRPSGRGAQGLLEALPQLPARRALVFLISDFNWPDELLPRLLRGLIHQDVVPVVLWDPAEADSVPERGFARLRDLETGAQRFVWLRPQFCARLRAAYQARAERLQQVFASAGTRPFYVRGGFDALAMTRYFMEAA